MAKKSKPYSNVVMPVKKILDKVVEIVDNKPINGDVPPEVVQVMAKIKEDTVVEFNPTLNAYVPHFNEKTKKYEIVIVSIDPSTDRMELFRKVLECDNEGSAFMVMQKMYADDAVKKIQDRRRKERNRG